jgi:hypothetical protein
MNLSAPKSTTFYIALVLGVLGILGFFIQLPFISGYAFWFVAIGFILLVLGIMLPDL